MIKIIFFILIFPTFVFAETYSCKYKELNQAALSNLEIKPNDFDNLINWIVEDASINR